MAFEPVVIQGEDDESFTRGKEVIIPNFILEEFPVDAVKEKVSPIEDGIYDKVIKGEKCSNLVNNTLTTTNDDVISSINLTCDACVVECTEVQVVECTEVRQISVDEQLNAPTNKMTVVELVGKVTIDSNPGKLGEQLSAESEDDDDDSLDKADEDIGLKFQHGSDVFLDVLTMRVHEKQHKRVMVTNIFPGGWCRLIVVCTMFLSDELSHAGCIAWHPRV